MVMGHFTDSTNLIGANARDIHNSMLAQFGVSLSDVSSYEGLLDIGDVGEPIRVVQADGTFLVLVDSTTDGVILYKLSEQDLPPLSEIYAHPGHNHKLLSFNAPTLVAGIRQLTATWTDPINPVLPVESFNVEYRVSGTTEWSDDTDVTSPHIITGLTAGDTYEVRIAAAHNDDTFTYSEVASATPQSEVSVPTIGLRAQPLNSGINLIWEDEGARYDVSYSLIDGLTREQQQVTPNAAITGRFTNVHSPFSIRGLINGLQYRCWVTVIQTGQRSVEIGPVISIPTPDGP